VTEIDSSPETVRRLVALVADNGLTELTVDLDGLTVTVKAEPDAAAPAGPVSVYTQPTASSQAPVTVTPRTARPSTVVALESPMVGVFYRSPSPEDPPFIHVGDIIRVGQAIGLIEAMKVFSEVPAEAAGRVTEIPAESGKLVQQGQPLVYIEPA
jgi:acetyl-CoA carboxylase biotin carboxyl carrier protein